MRCINCGRISFSIICSLCEKVLSEYEFQKRQVGELKVYSFYRYGEIKNLIHSKHNEYGKFVFEKLAKLSLKKFARNFKFGSTINAVPIDDNVRSGYSHTAILANSLKSKDIKPVFNCLRANSHSKYSGQSLEYRLKHKREFILNKKPVYPVILVDDIITTGLTLSQAYDICKIHDINVLFALVLANAKE